MTEWIDGLVRAVENSGLPPLQRLVIYATFAALVLAGEILLVLGVVYLRYILFERQKVNGASPHQGRRPTSALE